MEAIGALAQRVTTNERRLDHAESRVTEAERELARQDTRCALTEQSVKEIREDIADVRRQVTMLIRTVGAAATCFLLCAATILAALLASHG